jgi:HK97 gp10 family phage protein
MTEVMSLQGGEELERKLKRMGKDANRVLDDAAEAGGRVIRDAARAMAPGPHIEMEVERRQHQAQVAIGPDKDHWYYRFRETGAGRHRITPDKAQALRFESGGETQFAAGVDHPGMAADPFLRPAYDENKDRAERAVGDTIRKAVT